MRSPTQARWSVHSGARRISFPGVQRSANAEYDGQDYTGFISTGYHFSIHRYTLTPFVSLQYSHVKLDGYQETGAGDLNLNVESQDYDFVESGVGVKIARDFEYQGKTYVPEVHVKWLHELNNPTIAHTAAFMASGSSSFTVNGLKTSDDTFNVGAGLTLLSCACSARTWSLEAGYDYEWREDGYAAHQAMVRFAARF